MPPTPPRLLIVGGTGALGHRAWIEARERVERGEIDAMVGVRSPHAPARWPDLFDPGSTLVTGDLVDPDAIDEVLAAARPTAVLNAAGLVKQRYGEVSAEAARTVNAEVPHLLAERCAAHGIRMLHLSTDCVFSGVTPGPHTEAAVPDPVDQYGCDKLAGEPCGPGVLTVRTSLIGRELVRSAGLVEWLVSVDQQRVKGFTQARFSGLVTATLARILVDLLVGDTVLEGTYHLAAEPVDKHRLLVDTAAALGLDVEVEPVDEPVVDRALDGSKLAAATGIEVPSWPDMLRELRADADRYVGWRGGA